MRGGRTYLDVHAETYSLGSRRAGDYAKNERTQNKYMRS